MKPSPSFKKTLMLILVAIGCGSANVKEISQESKIDKSTLAKVETDSMLSAKLKKESEKRLTAIKEIRNQQKQSAQKIDSLLIEAKAQALRDSQ